MKRTCNRPLPAGRITTAGAVGYGALSLGASYATLKYGTNDTTLMLGFSNIVLYGLYTVSKPKTEWNTWTGAVVGAIPPIMGWTAAGGDILALEPALLGATLFLWQVAYSNSFSLNLSPLSLSLYKHRHTSTHIHHFSLIFTVLLIADIVQVLLVFCTFCSHIFVSIYSFLISSLFPGSTVKITREDFIKWFL
jgi:heme O synthase-like polyprenyltransferase